MKKLIIGLSLLTTVSAYAVTSTDMQSKWICTTNASSSSEEADKNADDKMAKIKNQPRHHLSLLQNIAVTAQKLPVKHRSNYLKNKYPRALGYLFSRYFW